MTVVPLPASPCLRVQLIYGGEGTERAGSRFFLSYSGSAPTGANCNTLATDISAAWGTHIAPLVSYFALLGVDVLDIATATGLSGAWSGEIDGSYGTSGLIPSSTAMNVEFNIARRYRGGKPRMFWPGGDSAALVNQDTWTTAYQSSWQTAVPAFFSEIEALSVGAIGTLAHVNLSYYQGFTNHTNTSGRERAVPTYRDAALLDTITGYAVKAEIGSQRRRRTSTTP